jgi:DNA-binding GntR family transcriptional regulator
MRAPDAHISASSGAPRLDLDPGSKIEAPARGHTGARADPTAHPPGPPGEPVPPQTLNRIPVDILGARVAQEIRTAILRGDLPPGRRVKQEDLAAQLGVSREPVRQALLMLQREGLVHAQPNRSAQVAPVDRHLIADVYGLREAVETSIVATLARRPGLDVKPFRLLIARGRNAVRQRDLTTLIELDMSFHTKLYEAAGNQVIVDVMHGQWGHIRRIMAMVLDRAAYRQKIWDEHEAIVQAIDAGRAASAIAAAGRHIRAARKMLLSVFEAAEPANPAVESEPT